jgi:Leucine rich repeat
VFEIRKIASPWRYCSNNIPHTTHGSFVKHAQELQLGPLIHSLPQSFHPDNTQRMRELSQPSRTWRDPKAATIPSSATPADDGLAAIMARRRALADSSSATTSSPRRNNKIESSSPVIVNSELTAAMERRQAMAETMLSSSSSQHNNQRLVPPLRQPSALLPETRSRPAVQSSSVFGIQDNDSPVGQNNSAGHDESRRHHNDSCSTASFSVSSLPHSGSSRPNMENIHELDNEPSVSSGTNEDTTTSDEVEDEAKDRTDEADEKRQLDEEPILKGENDSSDDEEEDVEEDVEEDKHDNYERGQVDKEPIQKHSYASDDDKEDEGKDKYDADDDDDDEKGEVDKEPILTDENNASDDDEDMFLLDDQTAQSMDQFRHHHDDDEHSSAPDSERNSRCEDDDTENDERGQEEGQEEFENERIEANSYETDSDHRACGSKADKSTVVTKETTGKNDSFFQDPGEFNPARWEEAEQEDDFGEDGSTLSRLATNSYATDGDNRTLGSNADESTVVTKETAGRNDSFFQDPGDYGTNNSYDNDQYLADCDEEDEDEDNNNNIEEEDDDDDDEDEDENEFDCRFRYSGVSTRTGLTTLTEERTIDLMSMSDLGGNRRAGENESVNDAQTIPGQGSVFDDKTVSDGPTVFEDQSEDQSYFGAEKSYCNDGRSQDVNGQEFYCDDGANESSRSGSGSDDDGPVSISEEDDDDSITADYAGDPDDPTEDDPIMEIETMNSSVVSSGIVNDSDAWSQNDTPSYLLDRHFQASNSEEYDYMFEDGEKSILGGLSVLDVVHEEASVDASEDVSASESQPIRQNNFSPSHSRQERITSRKPDIMSSRIEEDMDEGEDEGKEEENSNDSGSSEDLEAARPYEQSFSTRHKSKQSDSYCGYCSLPFVAIMVLLASLLLGLAVGLFLLGFPKEEIAIPSKPNLVPPTIMPASSDNIISEPDLPKDTLFLYNLICPKLWSGRSCEETLLDMSIPSGMAFDWLSNNKLSNPTVAIAERRILQRFALAAFFFATNGYHWTVNTQWLSEIHECDWYTTSFRGHGCDEKRDIFIALELDFNNVQGMLPAELSLLQDLEVISLQNPDGPAIEGVIPSTIAALSRLRSLQIIGNSFSGGIPTEFGALGGSLQSLVLRGNGLNGRFPSTIASLRSLTLLDLSDNHFAGEIDNEMFQSLAFLDGLDLSGNKFTRLPDSLSALTRLTKLDVSDNDFRWFPLPIFSLGESLKWLDIRKNNFREPIPPSIGRLVNLLYLNLASSSFTGSIPVELGNLLNLTETLDLSDNFLIGSIPTRLGRLTSLKRLLLNSNRLSGSIPSELAMLNQSVQVRLDDNELNGFVPAQLCDLYDEIHPSSYADCEKFVFAECFLYCCSKELGCRCQWETTDPLRCVSTE